MGATDKGIPYTESDDLIAGWPAADKLQAEKIDELLGDNAQDIADNSQELADLKGAVESNAQDIADNAQGIATNAQGIATNAQDLADFEATLDGGNAGQVLTKSTNADGDYMWADSQGGGGGGTQPGDPYPGISTDDPNMLGIGSDTALVVQPEDAISDDAGNSLVVGADGKLWSSGAIDVDAAGTIDFGTTGPPVQLYGRSRPDEFGTHGGAIIAPPGSTYTCTKWASAAPNMGAQQWYGAQANGKWQCVASNNTVLSIAVDGPTGDNFWQDDTTNAMNFYVYSGRTVEIGIQGAVAKQYLPDPIQLGRFTQLETVNGTERNLIMPPKNLDMAVWSSPTVRGDNPIYQNANNPRRCWLDWQGYIYAWGGDWQTSQYETTQMVCNYQLPQNPNSYRYPTAPPVFEPTTVTSLEAQIREAEQTKTSELDPSVVHLDAWKKQLTDMESKL